MSAKRKRKDGKTSDPQTSEVFKTSEVSDIPAPYELPDGWRWATIGEACHVNPSMKFPERFTKSTPVHFVPMSAVDEVSGAIAAPEPRPIGEVWKGYKRFQEGDVIFARITPCMENGKAAIATNLLNGIGLGSTEFHILRPTESVSREWVYHFVRQPSFRNEAARAMTGTAGQLRVPADFIVQAAIPLPPLPEQRRIVAKIEQLFAESRTARDALERVPPLLKHFRQSVLAAAFRGQLTERDPNDEPASALLERIRAQRLPKSSRLRKSEDTPALPPPGTSALPELPEGWEWANVEQACAQIVDCPHSTPKFKESGFLCVDTNSIEPGRIVLERVRHVDESTFKNRIRRMKPRESDVIFSREGGLLGIAVLVPPNLEFCLGQRLMIFRLGEIINPKYFEIVLNSQFFRDQYTPRIGGTASPHLNIRDIRKLEIPLPPLAEQRRIVARIEALFAQADAVERAVAIAWQRADKIDQAILSRAFRGEL